MNKRFTSLLLMSLPGLALGAWAWLIGRMAHPLPPVPGPSRIIVLPPIPVPLKPIPLDEPHIEAEVARQVTLQLKPVTWQAVPGRWFKFEALKVRSCKIESSKKFIDVDLAVNNSPTSLSKTQPQANDNLDYYLKFNLKRSPDGTRYNGHFFRPGLDATSTHHFGVSVPVQIPKD